MTARRRQRRPVDLYAEHGKRVAAEAEGWIAAHGRGAWIDEMAARRAHQNALDLLRLELGAQVIDDDRRSRVPDHPVHDPTLSDEWSAPLRTGGAA